LERLKVLHLLPELRDYGGAEIALANIVDHMNFDRFDVSVGGLFAGGGLVERLHLPPGNTVSFGFKWGSYHTDILAYRHLVSFIRDRAIHIVHTHLPQGNTLGRIAGRIAGVPILVATEHNTYLGKNFRGILADRLLSRVTTQHIAVSNAVARFAAEQARISLGRFVVIPSPVSLDQIPRLSLDARMRKRVELGVSVKDLIVTTVGRLIPQKGHSALIDAARELRPGFPEVKFLIVGAGPLEASLRNQVDRLGLRENVIFLGLRKDVYDLLQVTDVFCFPSMWEGLGVALLEAGACRLPAVASAVGGIPEIIQDGENGFLVQPGDSVALAQRIGTLLKSPEMRARMGNSGRSVVESRYSAEVVAGTIMQLYENLWVNRRRRSGL
jgi:glycosyltransferase involved in cell wall biosynthesis